jgi:hypothetical protein
MLYRKILSPKRTWDAEFTIVGLGHRFYHLQIVWVGVDYLIHLCPVSFLVKGNGSNNRITSYSSGE